MSKASKHRGRSLFARFISTVFLLALVVILVAVTYLALDRIDEPVRTGIYENIVANLVTAAGLTLLAAFAFIWLSVIRRQRLFTFFGIRRGMLRIRFYLGQLQVQRGGTKGVEEITGGYVGPAIVKMEYDASLLLQGLFEPRAAALIPEVLRELLSALFITLAEVEANIEMSPTLQEFSPSVHLAQNLVTCGGGTYNAISSHYLGLKQAFYTFDYGQDGAHILRSLEESPLDFAALGRASKHELACIQRLKDPDSDSIVFICAGLGSGATYGAVEYLVRNWNQLRRKYRNREFGVCLSYATAEPDGIPTVTPRIIHQVVRPKGRR